MVTFRATDSVSHEKGSYFGDRLRNLETQSVRGFNFVAAVIRGLRSLSPKLEGFGILAGSCRGSLFFENHHHRQGLFGKAVQSRHCPATVSGMLYGRAATA